MYMAKLGLPSSLRRLYRQVMQEIWELASNNDSFTSASVPLCHELEALFLVIIGRESWIFCSKAHSLSDHCQFASHVKYQ